MNGWTHSEIAGLVAMIVAAMQVIAAPWRDLGIVTLASVGGVLVLARGEPTFTAAGCLLVAGGLAAWAWNRGSRRGVGRPGLAGVGGFIALVAGLWPFLMPDFLPPSVTERLVEAAIVALGMTASVGLALALERPGPRRRRPRFFRRVEVVEHPARARGEGPSAEPDPSATAPDAA